MSERDIHDLAETLVKMYREANSAFERSEVIKTQVRSIKPSQVRLLVTYFWKNKVPVDHKDLTFLHKMLNFAIIQESGVLNEDQLKASQKHSEAAIAKGPSSTPDEEVEEDIYKPLPGVGDNMETQTEKRKSKSTKSARKEGVEKALRKRATADWYDKDTKFVATPDKTDYKPNAKSRPALAYPLMHKPITMARLIEKFKASMEESGMSKGVKNLDALSNRWIPVLVKWLLEHKAAKIAKDDDNGATEERTAKKKEKSEKKAKQKEASAQ